MNKFSFVQVLTYCKENGIEIIYYADYDYDFPYEVIKDKNKLLSIILEKK